MWWQRLIGKRRPNRQDRGDIDIWRLQSLFNNFRRILFLNNAILENMAQMEQALGGEYIYDRAFLESAIRTLASRVHHVTYNLNALTDNGYITLYDRYQDIRTRLDDILAGNYRALAGVSVVPLEAVGWELEPVVGIDLVCLAELRHYPGSPIAEGFIVTAEGTRVLFGSMASVAGAEPAGISAAEVRVAIDRQCKVLLGDRQDLRVSVTAVRLEGKGGLVNELGRFVLAPDPSPSPHLLCLEQIIGTVCSWLASEGTGVAGDFAMLVRAAPPADLCGIVRTRTTMPGPIDTLSITASLPESEAAGDTFLLRRTYPFDLVQSRLAPRPGGFRFADGRLATDPAATGGFGRGSALVEARILKNLAETAMILERMAGTPVAVQWEFRKDGSYCITGLSSTPVVVEEISGHDLAREQEGAEILCRTGQLVQSGIAAGMVVHVADGMPPAEFPAGAVAVARAASPPLTPVLQRAAAIITEYGTTTGHLATVARELRLPAIFGVPGALDRLPPGTEVTVDASETTVYRGILEKLLRHGAREMDLSPSDPEYRTLRRLLRFIMPLNLIDPGAPNFSPEGCRTFHDIIHFCHEKAIDELAHFQERRPGLGAIRTRSMNLGVPMDIRVLDIGGGMANGSVAEPGRAEARSVPFSVFLEGLLDPRGWATDPPSLGLRDIISSMPRSMGMLAGPASGLGANLAIVGHDYMNISLRLGYHFSVIDAHLGADGSRNYVYFRFAGGLADPERRRRRAKFISDVLAAMEFKVSVQGDLVIGRLKMAEMAALRAALWSLGALTAFSRQRDTGLHSEADARALFTRFAHTFLEGGNRQARSASIAREPSCGAAANSQGVAGVMGADR